MLEIERIGKRFANGHEALGDVNLAVAEGEIVAVVGASGCGKSTLLRLVAGLERPTDGPHRRWTARLHRARRPRSAWCSRSRG